MAITYGKLKITFMKMQTNRMQKITVHIPQLLLHAALEVTKKNITETVKAGLERMAREQAYENIRNMRGKVKFSVDLNKLRKEDR